MKVSHLFSGSRPVISFEFFPPKTEDGLKNLTETITSLKELAPSYVSITYGAGGSTRAKTVELVSKIKKDIGIEAVAHLTCVGHSQSELEDILRELTLNNVENILALRGDPPQGQTLFVPVPDGFKHAFELVQLIKKKFSFCVGVAGYPEKHLESPSLEKDLHHFGEKVAAGADFVVTQLFFDNADYFSFVSRVRAMNIRLPVVAGIMPITDFDQIKRFATLCGAKIPKTLASELEKAGKDKERVVQIGIEHALNQCRDLLKNGAPGIHFYTLNKSQSTRAIFTQLKKEGLVS